jgi:hypothetical protein
MPKGRSEKLRAGKWMLFAAACAALVFLILAGCDMLTSDIPPDKLPPVPEKCQSLSDQHKNALSAAYTSVGASQMQVTRVANEFAQCLQDEGLSRAEAKGILKKNEAEAKAAADKSGGNDVYMP